MDVTLIENFRKLVNGSIDEIITSVIEQYDTEMKRLEDVIMTSTEMLREKESLVSELKKQLEDNEFNEENFNKVSLLKTLSRQVDDLTKENKTLNDSLRLRREHSNSLCDDSQSENMTLSTHEVNDTEVNEEMNEEVNDTEVSENVINVEEVNNTNEELQIEESVVIGDNNLELEEDDDDEVEVEMEEINHKDKTYYVKDSKLYNKKKNGDIGKEVGTYINGKPKLNKKKKKDKMSN